MPESFCTHRNVSSNEFSETKHILRPIKIYSWQTLGVLFIVIAMNCSVVVVYTIIFLLPIALLGAGERLWPCPDITRTI